MSAIRPPTKRADPVPCVAAFAPRHVAPGGTILAAGPKFVAERWTGAGSSRIDPGTRVRLIPVAAGAMADGEPLEPGGAWLAEDAVTLTLAEGADVMLMYAGAAA